jgi:hypothetical protein
VGDLLFTLAAFANANRLDLETCPGRGLEKHQIRDIEAWKART